MPDKVISTIGDIDLSIPEGRLLFAALVKLSTESQTDKEPDTILGQVNTLADEMATAPADAA